MRKSSKDSPRSTFLFSSWLVYLFCVLLSFESNASQEMGCRCADDSESPPSLIFKVISGDAIGIDTDHEKAQLITVVEILHSGISKRITGDRYNLNQINNECMITFIPDGNYVSFSWSTGSELSGSSCTVLHLETDSQAEYFEGLLSD